jgi:hypothetical protein
MVTNSVGIILGYYTARFFNAMVDKEKEKEKVHEEEKEKEQGKEKEKEQGKEKEHWKEKEHVNEKDKGYVDKRRRRRGIMRVGGGG